MAPWLLAISGQTMCLKHMPKLETLPAGKGPSADWSMAAWGAELMLPLNGWPRRRFMRSLLASMPGPLSVTVT